MDARSHRCSYKREAGGSEETERRRWRDHTSRERCEDALVLVLEMQEGAAGHGIQLQKLEKARKQLLPESFCRELSPARLTVDLQPPEL